MKHLSPQVKLFPPWPRWWALFLTLPLCAPASGQTLAFPGAMGFGAFATGGRGGTVYHVTTLADSGPGSFREAVSRPHRIIVFDVGGYIDLRTAVAASGSLTIAGQTAPGEGIGLMGAEVSFYGQTNIICRHVRFRQGDVHNAANPKNSHESALNLGSRKGTPLAGNMIFDHVSIEFASWDNIDAVNTVNFTVQNSIIANPVKLQQFGAHVEGTNASWINNLWVNEHNRQPLAKADTLYVNNVVCNYQMGYTCGRTAGHFSHDIVNNYFIAGPSTKAADDDFFQIGDNQTIYAAGNWRGRPQDGVLSGSPTSPQHGGVVLTAPWSPVTAALHPVSAAAACRIDVSSSGTFPRDQVDQQVIADVVALGATGKLLASQTETGLGNNGYGVIAGGPAPADTDQDGLPDYWEEAAGSDPSRADSLKMTADGYTLLEHYLNWLAAPHAIAPANHPLEVNLSVYAAGFTNARPVYAVFQASHGAVTLLPDGHTARFTPPENFRGLAGFKFSVTVSDIPAWTNTVGVLLEPATK